MTTSLRNLASLAVDPQGNLWILSGTSPGVQKWTWTPGTTANGGYVVSVPSTNFLPSYNNLTVDPYGNIYETSGLSVLKGAYVNGTFTVTTAFTVGGNQAIAALAVDLAGDVYYTLLPQFYTGASAAGPLYVARPTSTGYAIAQVGTLGSVYGLAVDRTGNVYTADGNYAFRYPVTDTPTTGTVTWTDNPYAGTTDSNAYTVQVSNVGNLPLLFTSPSSGTNPSVPSPFLFDSASTCSEQTPVSATQVLNPGQGCNVLLQFAPPARTQYTGNVVFTDNSAGSSTQVVPVSGTAASLGTGTTAQTITFPQPAPVNFSTTPSETMTASATSGLQIVYTIVSGPANVSGSTVSFTGTGTVMVNARQDGNATYAPASSVTVSITVRASGTIWVVNNDSTLARISDTGALDTAGIGKSAYPALSGGVAFDSTGQAWSVTPSLNALDFAGSSGSTTGVTSHGGLSLPVSVAVDGANRVWVANSYYSSVSEFTNAGAAVSGASGYATAAGLNTPSSVAVDGAGGVWITSKKGSSVTHVFGAATPVVTPIARGTANGSNAVEP